MAGPHDKSNLYGTPMQVFCWLNKVWGPFELDAAASESNRICKRWLGPGSTEGEDALKVDDWNADRVFINPPYSQPWIPRFVEKAVEQASKFPGRRVVLLLPHDSSTDWHWIAKRNGMIRELETRVRFDGANGAKFANVAVVFDSFLTDGGYAKFCAHHKMGVQSKSMMKRMRTVLTS